MTALLLYDLSRVESRAAPTAYVRENCHAVVQPAFHGGLPRCGHSAASLAGAAASAGAYYGAPAPAAPEPG